MPSRPRDLPAERDANDRLEAQLGRCGVCHRPLEPIVKRRIGPGGTRRRETCSPRCRQWRKRHPEDFDRGVIGPGGQPRSWY